MKDDPHQPTQLDYNVLLKSECFLRPIHKFAVVNKGHQIFELIHKSHCPIQRVHLMLGAVLIKCVA